MFCSCIASGGLGSGSLGSGQISQFHPGMQERINVLVPDNQLRVCLCDIEAKDVVLTMMGLPITSCAMHNAVKLQSLMNARCTLSFARPDGKTTTLEEALLDIPIPDITTGAAAKES